MGSPIKHKPDAPKNLTSIKRDDNVFKISWKIPASGSSSTGNKRWESISRSWKRYDPDKKNKKKKKGAWVKGPKSTQGSISKNSTSNQWTLARSDFYPCKDDKGRNHPKITQVRYSIHSHNKKGSSKTLKKTYVIEKPEAPKITWSYDENTGEVTIKLDMKQTGKHERYNTSYTVWRRDTGLHSSRYSEGKWVKALDSDSKVIEKTTRATEETLVHNTEVSVMPAGSKIEICVASTTRGLAGDTVVSQGDSSAMFTIMAPIQVAITEIKLQDKNGGTPISKWQAANGKTQVMVFYNAASGSASAKYDKNAPTNYELQRLITAESISTAAQAQIQTWNGTAVDKNMGTTSDAMAASTKNGSAPANSADAVLGEAAVDVISDMMSFAATSGVPYNCRVWYRIKSTRQGMVNYSDPVEAKEFFVPRPSAANDYSAYVWIGSGGDGTFIETLHGWGNPDKPDEGVDLYPDAKWTTEASWSEYPDGWESTEQPSTYDITWKDSLEEHAARLDQSGYIDGDINTGERKIKWDETAALTIRGLTPGTPYYLKTRRHMVYGDIEEYGPYTPAPEGYWPFVPVDDPTEVACSVSGPMVLGESLRVSWRHNANSEQKFWAIYVVEIPTLREDSGDVSLPITVPAKNLHRKLIMSGTDATDFAVIPFDKLTEIFPSVDVIDNSTTPATVTTIDTSSQIGIGVSVGTGGSVVDSYSDPAGMYTGLEIVDVVSRPMCECRFPETLTSQGAKFYVFTNTSSAKAICNVIADGVTIPLPDGDLVQAEDDYVYTTVLADTGLSIMVDSPLEAWLLEEEPEEPLSYSDYEELIDSGYTHYWEVDLPGGLDLYDGASYHLDVSCVSTASDLLRSPVSTAHFDIAYGHQAMQPGIMTRCETRSNGGSPYVEIYVQKPENWVSTDRCNVYRITPDRGYLIASGVEFESTVIDRYPPFSKVANLRYAVTTVTEDNDFETVEVPYALKRHGLRFDWGDQIAGVPESFIELPFDIELSDSFEKDSDVRRHMNGEDEALFNDGVTRTGALKTKLVKLESPEQFEKLRDLARFPGTALCRAHDGTCYECLVNVGGIDNTYDSLVVPVTISTREVALSSRFEVKAADIRKVNETFE